MDIYDLIEISLLVGLLYSLFTIGISFSFRVLNYPDLTLEGSVILGGALSYFSIQLGINPFISLLIGTLGGALAGAFTAIQYLYFGVSKLLSGIITTAMLYSINIRLLGGVSNVRFENSISIFRILNPTQDAIFNLIILLIIVFGILTCIVFFFKTRLGLLLRSLGDNEKFIVTLAESPRTLTIVGLTIANGIIGLGGAILVHYNNTVDVNMSFGLLIGALAAMVLGESIVSSNKIWHYFSSNIIGTVIYSIAIALVVFSWSDQWEQIIYASDIKFFTGLLLIIPTFVMLKKSNKFKLFSSDW